MATKAMMKHKAWDGMLMIPDFGPARAKFNDCSQVLKQKTNTARFVRFLGEIFYEDGQMVAPLKEIQELFKKSYVTHRLIPIVVEIQNYDPQEVFLVGRCRGIREREGFSKEAQRLAMPLRHADATLQISVDSNAACTELNRCLSVLQLGIKSDQFAKRQKT